MKPRPLSLRRRLILILLIGLSIVGLFTTAWIHKQSNQELHQLLDAQLSKSARLILASLTHEYEEHNDDDVVVKQLEEMNELVHDYEQPMSYWIWSRNDTLLLRSHTAPTHVQAPHPPGFSDVQIQGVPHRSFVLHHPETGLKIQVAESTKERDELSETVALSALTGGVIGLPLLTLFVWIGVSKGLAPLRRVAQEVQGRSGDDLRPIDSTQVPEEILPITESLNGLLARIHSALDKEKRFTADAAHELRTPLAGIKIQAQVALKELDAQARTQALQSILTGVDRTTQLVEQLLVLARADNAVILDPESRQSVDLGDLLTDVVNELQQAEEIEINDVELELDNPVILHNAHPDTLRIMIRNLLENALRHGQPDNRQERPVVRLKAWMENMQAKIQIQDWGPGIEEQDHHTVLNRFHRGRKARASGYGTGLGLSIVQKAVEVHRANLKFTHTKGHTGLTVQIEFPKSTNP